MSASMKQPGPDHPMSIEPEPRRVRVTLGGRVIADTTQALRLAEASYKPVVYVPRADADMPALTRTQASTHCPYKGDASYFSIADGPANAVWSYEKPYPAAAKIAGHLAFYPDKVDAIEFI